MYIEHVQRGWALSDRLASGDRGAAEVGIRVQIYSAHDLKRKTAGVRLFNLLLYLNQNTCYLTSNTTRVVQQY